MIETCVGFFILCSIIAFVVFVNAIKHASVEVDIKDYPK